MNDMKQFEIIIFCSVVLFIVFFAMIIYSTFTIEQGYEDFCQTTLIYNNGEHWCLNEEDEKLYAIGCESINLFSNQPINCYYKSNLVKEATE